MKRTGKIILITLVVMLAAGYLVGTAIWTGARQDTRTCTQLTIVIKDSHARQYVTAEELTNLLRKASCYPVGQPTNTLDVRAIEETIRSHSMVRQAECFVTPSGVVRVELTQRIPHLRVITNAESYFVDSDHKRMPVRESVHTDVLTAEGNIGERMACTELVAVADWITDNSYWHERITRIRVRSPHYIEFVQASGEPDIIVDNLTDYPERLARVRKLYDKGLNRLDNKPSYRELDVRFEGQVVGR